MTDDHEAPWDKHRRADLEAVMAEEMPDLSWRVREMYPGVWNRSGRDYMVSTDLGVVRWTRELTRESARRLAHEMALAVRLRDH